MFCTECGKRIPKKRLEILPETKVCVRCSDVKPLVGITVWDKTTPELLMVAAEEAKSLRRLERLGGRLNRL